MTSASRPATHAFPSAAVLALEGRWMTSGADAGACAKAGDGTTDERAVTIATKQGSFTMRNYMTGSRCIRVPTCHT